MKEIEHTECVITGDISKPNEKKPETDIIELKTCLKCKISKPILEFSKQKQNKNGLYSYCKCCVRKMNKIYFEKNKEKLQLNHKEDYKKFGYKWKSTRQNYQISHRNEFCKYTQKYRNNNRGRINKEIRKRYNEDIEFRLKKVIPSLIRKSLHGNKNNNHWEILVGYSLNKLKKHLELKFKDGMTWENYGEWHIDHIKPISSFKISNPFCKEFKECWCLSNLQPLWAFDNLSKGSKF